MHRVYQLVFGPKVVLLGQYFGYADRVNIGRYISTAHILAVLMVTVFKTNSIYYLLKNFVLESQNRFRIVKKQGP